MQKKTKQNLHPQNSSNLNGKKLVICERRNKNTFLSIKFETLRSTTEKYVGIMCWRRYSMFFALFLENSTILQLFSLKKKKINKVRRSH